MVQYDSENPISQTHVDRKKFPTLNSDSSDLRQGTPEATVDYDMLLRLFLESMRPTILKHSREYDPSALSGIDYEIVAPQVRLKSNNKVGGEMVNLAQTEVLFGNIKKTDAYLHPKLGHLQVSALKNPDNVSMTLAYRYKPDVNGKNFDIIINGQSIITRGVSSMEAYQGLQALVDTHG